MPVRAARGRPERRTPNVTPAVTPAARPQWHWSRQFSCPHEPADERAYREIAAGEAGALAAWLASAHAGGIARATAGVRELIASWRAESASLDDVWDVAFSQARLLSLGEPVDPTGVAVRLALRLTEIGHPGEWRARVPGTRGVRFGRRVLPPLDEVRVDHGRWGVRVTWRTSEGPPITAESDTRAGRGPWQFTGAPGEPQYGFGPGGRVQLLPAGSVPGDGRDPYAFPEHTALDTIDQSVARSFSAGYRVIASRAPEYTCWVNRLLRGIVVCRGDGTTKAVSGSTGDALGIIHASHSMKRMSVAETLVHESTHQYFYLLKLAGPVDDGTDHRAYWSPPVFAERPLRRILIAYHALANVLLFYDAVRASGGDDDGYVDENEPEMARQVTELDAPLRGNPALTELGRGLYEPLAERVARRARRGARSSRRRKNA